MPCVICDTVLKSEIIPVTEHDNINEFDENGHYNVCRACKSKSGGAEHDFENEICKVCGYEEVLVFALEPDGESYRVSGVKDKSRTEVAVPSNYKGLPVTVIGFEAFKGCKKLVSVTMPDTVETISENAFYSCESLTTVVLSANLKSIEKGAFFNCGKLENIEIPKSIEYIDDLAFYGCTLLEVKL